MKSEIVIVIVSADEVSDRKYRRVLKNLWTLCYVFGFEPHGYSSVFVGPKCNAEFFKLFVEAQGLKCTVLNSF